MRIPQIPWIVRLTGTLRTVGPYAAVVLLVPGGSLIGLYWAIRSRESLRTRLPSFLRKNALKSAHGMRRRSASPSQG